MPKASSAAIRPHRASSNAQGSVSSLESHVGFWLRFVSNHVSGAFQRLMEENGVSVTEWVALRQIFETGSAPPAELMGALGMTKGAVSKIVDRLQAKGLVQREAVQEGSRSQKIALTRTGLALVPRLAALADQNDEAFFGHLPPEKRRELAAVLKDLVQHHQLRQVPLK